MPFLFLLAFVAALLSVAFGQGARRAWYYTGNASATEQEFHLTDSFVSRSIGYSQLFALDQDTIDSVRKAAVSAESDSNSANRGGCEDVYAAGVYPFEEDGISRDWITYFGNVIAGFKNKSTSIEGTELAYLQTIIPELGTSYNDDDSADNGRNTTSLYVCMKTIFELSLSPDYAVPYSEGEGEGRGGPVPFSLEVGLFDHGKEEWEERRWMNATIGDLVATIVVSHGVVHEILFSTDKRDHYSLSYHRWYSLSTSSGDSGNSNDSKSRTSGATTGIMELDVSETGNTVSTNIPGGGGNTDVQSSCGSVNISIMTYNIWHNQPGEYVYPNIKNRWTRYEERMRHLASIIVENDPDVVVLQEVRVDNMFNALSKFGAHMAVPPSDQVALDGFDLGGQLTHLLKYLSQEVESSSSFSQKTADNDDSASRIKSKSKYHAAYQPGMLMYDRRRLWLRQEEGVAIISKRPIFDVSSLLLSRDVRDSKDDHQRVVLKASIEIVDTCNDKIGTIDVATTHFGLSEKQRAVSVREVDEFLADQGRKRSDSFGTILAGDFNAEHSEEAMRHLVANDHECHDMEYHSSKVRDDAASKDNEAIIDDMLLDISRSEKNSNINSNTDSDSNSDSNSVSNSGRFRDLWCELQGNKAKGSSGSDSDGDGISDNIEVGFTFPACNPTKRIDFILFRDGIANSSSSSSKRSASPFDIKISGRQYKGQRADSPAIRWDLGMLDKDSPIWASDHFPVTASLSLRRH